MASYVFRKLKETLLTWPTSEISLPEDIISLPTAHLLETLEELLLSGMVVYSLDLLSAKPVSKLLLNLHATYLGTSFISQMYMVHATMKTELILSIG